MGSSPFAVTELSSFAAVSSKEFLGIRVIYGISLVAASDDINTQSFLHCYYFYVAIINII